MMADRASIMAAAATTTEIKEAECSNFFLSEATAVLVVFSGQMIALSVCGGPVVTVVVSSAVESVITYNNLISIII